MTQSVMIQPYSFAGKTMEFAASQIIGGRCHETINSIFLTLITQCMGVYKQCWQRSVMFIRQAR